MLAEFMIIALPICRVHSSSVNYRWMELCAIRADGVAPRVSIADVNSEEISNGGDENSNAGLVFWVGKLQKIRARDTAGSDCSRTAYVSQCRCK
jgi:hypothetical protein